MIGVRFLTDYINGDNYFHTQYDEHNWVRAKNQFQLYSLLHAEVDQLNQYLLSNIDSDDDRVAQVELASG